MIVLQYKTLTLYFPIVLQSEVLTCNLISVLVKLKLSNELEDHFLQQLLLLTSTRKCSERVTDSIVRSVSLLAKDRSDDYVYNMCIRLVLGKHYHACFCDTSPRADYDAATVFATIRTLARQLKWPDATLLVKSFHDVIAHNNIEDIMPNLPDSCECKDTFRGIDHRLREPLLQGLASVFQSVCPDAVTSSSMTMTRTILENFANSEFTPRIVFYLSAKGTNELIYKLSATIQKNFEEKRDVQSLEVAIWLTKGLVMRNHPYAQQWIDFLLNLLKEEAFTDTIAKGIVTIHRNQEISHFSPVTFFHQKFYLITAKTILPCLSDQTFSVERRPAFRYALLAQLEFLPSAVIKSEAKRFYAAAIAALSDGSENQEIAIKCIDHLLDENNSTLLTTHLDSIITSFLKLLNASGKMNVKRSALVCLAKMTSSFPEIALIKLRKEVTNGLKPCLDDKKRMVRYAASEARLKWLMIGEPGSKQA